jgi:3-hydroxy-5-methyl-1-naphthoate 3-O-methyltransferase
MRGARALMNALVGIELLAKEGDRYTLTPESAAFLVTGRPGNLAGVVRHTSGLLPKWLDVAEVVRTGKSKVGVNREDVGSSFFQELVTDLFPLSYPAAQALADELKVAATTAPIGVLDLAAGSGVWSIALAQRSPRVRVRAVDWEGVLDVTRQMTRRFGVADRYEFIGGDLAQADFGRGHQVATLGHILHSQGEAGSRALLKKTFQSLAPGGTIAIQEFLVDPGRTSPPMSLIFAVNMLIATDDGDTFTFDEIAAWLREAGFKDARLLHTPGPSPLILATK